MGRCIFGCVLGGGVVKGMESEENILENEINVILPGIGASGFCQKIKSFH